MSELGLAVREGSNEEIKIFLMFKSAREKDSGTAVQLPQSPCFGWVLWSECGQVDSHLGVRELQCRLWITLGKRCPTRRINEQKALRSLHSSSFTPSICDGN